MAFAGFGYDKFGYENVVIILGKPPALPGDSQSLTVPGIGSLHRLNRSKFKQTEASCERLRKPEPLGMGLQVPRGLDPKVPQKGSVLKFLLFLSPPFGGILILPAMPVVAD